MSSFECNTVHSHVVITGSVHFTLNTINETSHYSFKLVITGNVTVGVTKRQISFFQIEQNRCNGHIVDKKCASFTYPDKLLGLGQKGCYSDQAKIPEYLIFSMIHEETILSICGPCAG